jgi:hypothetical protein
MEPGISVERNRCAALMAKLLAKAALAAQRIGGETELCRLLDFKAGYGQLGEEGWRIIVQQNQRVVFSLGRKEHGFRYLY